MTAAYRMHCSGRFCRVVAGVLLPTLVYLGCAAGLVTSAVAQNTAEEFKAAYPDWPYPIVEIPPRLREKGVENTLRALVEAIMRGDTAPDKSLPPNEKAFDEYFKDIIFRRWTHPSYLTKIAKDRVILLRYLQSSKNPAAHERLGGLIGEVMPKFAGGNYHPALRYNAVLLLGELNSKEMPVFGGKAPAVPLITMLPVLLDHVTKPELIDAVRVGALIGIRRHVDEPLPAPAKAQIIDKLLPLLAAAPPAGRTPEGHAWIQKQVIEILGAVGDAGNGGAVVTQLRKIVVDPSRSLSLRCAASVALSQLPLVPDPKQLAGELGAVGVEACRVELTWLKGRIEQRMKELEAPAAPVGEAAAPRRPDDLGNELLGGDSGDEVVEQGDPVLNRCNELARRRLKTRLNAVKTALEGISGRAGAAGTEIVGLTASVSEVMKVLDDTELAPEDLQEKVYAEAVKLETAVKGMLGPAKAPGSAPKTGPATAPAGGAATPPAATKPDAPEDVPF